MPIDFFSYSIYFVFLFLAIFGVFTFFRIFFLQFKKKLLIQFLREKFEYKKKFFTRDFKIWICNFYNKKFFFVDQAWISSTCSINSIPLCLDGRQIQGTLSSTFWFFGDCRPKTRIQTSEGSTNRSACLSGGRSSAPAEKRICWSGKPRNFKKIPDW